MVFRNILFLIFTLYSCESNGIILTQYPPSKVDIGSSQIISWKSPVVLDSVSIDLYQRSQFKQNLGQTNQNLNNFSYNVMIANMHETYNFLQKHLKNNLNSNDLSECYKKILIIFSPVLPHLINECLSEMNYNKNNLWPETEQKYLEKMNIDYVIQINGKKRALLGTEPDQSEEVIFNQCLEIENVKKLISEKNIIKKM